MMNANECILKWECDIKMSQICCGNNHSLYLTNNSVVYAFGSKE
jgi:alpha-tubulin suppressor-like RCC1 family protein